ncbi:MAG: 3-phosphoshikimate 1-carboxyvinyltransferase [Methanoregula sp.]|nr:3-phosphoshikimate 1-carboxyvinyltransferase [Methanoregula sp.]
MIVTPQRRKAGDLVITAPPSKSFTHRALIMGALGTGPTTILHPLYAEDTLLTINALRMLGISIEVHPDRVIVSGCDGKFADHENTVIDLDNSGTSLRLITPLALLCRHPVTLTGSRRMQERPIGPLAQALHSLGGTVHFLKKEGYPPLTVSGHLQGGRAVIDGSISSQFISSILITAPYAETEVEVIIPSRPVSGSYLDITAEVMQAFGAEVRREGYTRFSVSNTRHYAGRTYAIEGDYSSSSYFFAIAAICGSRMTVKNLEPGSVQGDRRFPGVLESMGCTVTYAENEVTVERTGELHGITVDMSTSPDTVQTLCMVAAMAKTPTTISGISHLKFKESDRITSTAERLNALGGDVQVGDDRIMISPSPLHGGVIDPDNDHRTAMSFAVLGLGIGGITITNAECVNKSFPAFWDIIGRM